MAKTITYKLATDGVPHGTKTLICATEADLEANLPIAQEEAYNGEYTIEDDGRPAPAPVGDAVTWDELDSAYQEGYQEGVDSV